MDTLVLADQQKLTFISSTDIEHRLKKKMTKCDGWLGQMERDRETKESVLSARLDDEDEGLLRC